MTKLSVNINKIALLRNSRGGNLPNLNQVAKDCETFGADGITVHPRPDERHIRYSDVYELKPVVNGEFNIEGYPTERFLKMVLEVKPHQCTLVPDPPEALTSNAGWNTILHQSFLKEVITQLRTAGIRTSLFLEPKDEMIQAAAETGTDRIELYTGPYAYEYQQDRNRAVKPFSEAALIAAKYNLGLNAGHDLNLENLHFFNQQVSGLLEVSIGHALVSDALYFGLQNIIPMYKKLLDGR